MLCCSSLLLSISCSDPSFRPADANGIGIGSIGTLTLGNYVKGFNPAVDIRQNVIKSLSVALSVAVIVSVVSTLAGYALSKIRFRSPP